VDEEVGASAPDAAAVGAAAPARFGARSIVKGLIDEDAGITASMRPGLGAGAGAVTVALRSSRTARAASAMTATLTITMAMGV
jgi:hypothetical protein